MKEFHQAIADKIEDDDDDESDDELAKDYDPLPFGMELFQKADIEGDIPNGVHQEKEGKGNREHAHMALWYSKARGKSRWAVIEHPVSELHEGKCPIALVLHLNMLRKGIENYFCLIFRALKIDLQFLEGPFG
jgi:hypothetical protein